MLKVVIIGRENVGKSTLFNKLCQKEFSIVNNQPGVTRDYVKHIARLFDIEFELTDTAGWYSNKNKKGIKLNIKENILSAIEEADLIFFVVDARASLLDEDLILAKKVRKLKKKIMLLANKAESKLVLTPKELSALGLGEAIFISAEHKLGFDEIYNRVGTITQETFINTEITEKNCEAGVSVCIIGRPNVGKSTLFNAILGFERSLVSEIAGTTRDHVIYQIKIFDTTINLIDTAGVRKKSKVHEDIEELSVNKTISAIRASDIVLLIMDSQLALEKQDLTLANLVLKYNKLLIPIINKKDLIGDITEFRKEINYLFKKRLPQIKDIDVLYTSAEKNFNPKVLFQKIIDLWDLYQTRIQTSKLNDWLTQTLKAYSLPMINNNTRLKIKYVKQSSIQSPSFLFFTNISSNFSINKNFEKFLINSLRKHFKLYGIPIKANFILSKNPFIL